MMCSDVFEQVGQTPLYAACVELRTEVVRCLLSDNRVDVNKRSKVNEAILDHV